MQRQLSRSFWSAILAEMVAGAVIRRFLGGRLLCHVGAMPRASVTLFVLIFQGAG